MSYYTIYNVKDSRVRGVVSCPDSAISLQHTSEEAYIKGAFADATHIIDGSPVVIPPDPPSTEELLSTLRRERDMKLLACDWTQLQDAPVDKEVWSVYRQALRDFPSTCDDLSNPTWPIPPSQ